jgi:hypothetical protein
MILIFYNKYICIQGGPQGAENFEKEKKHLNKWPKIVIAVVEHVSHMLGITVL